MHAPVGSACARSLLRRRLASHELNEAIACVLVALAILPALRLCDMVAWPAGVDADVLTVEEAAATLKAAAAADDAGLSKGASVKTVGGARGRTLTK